MSTNRIPAEFYDEPAIFADDVTDDEAAALDAYEWADVTIPDDAEIDSMGYSLADVNDWEGR
jgi:hypothetical protein